MLLMSISISRFLQAKFVDWQHQQRQRRTIEEFADFVGVSRPLMSQWMNGKKQPGSKNRERLIEVFGTDALEAFGIDPGLYIVQKKWDDLEPETRQEIQDLATRSEQKNDTKRTHQKRATGKSG
jgi:transcriptional regulator with XRE-family HTH domain